MHDGDWVEIGGREVSRGGPARPGRGADEARPWLGVLFRCCNVYGRLYRNRSATAYEGGCPRCGVPVRAGIGPGGTSKRFFVAE